MKFRIHLSANRTVLPFDYANLLTGVFHYWLGPNDLHNMLSLYSLGWLKGRVEQTPAGLNFPDGASWDIGIWNDEIAERLIRGLLMKPPVLNGMMIQRVERLKTPVFVTGKTVFGAGSPILLRRKSSDEKREFVLYNDPESPVLLKRTLDHKLKEAGKPELSGHYAIYFDQEYPNPKTRLITVSGIKNKASVCPLVLIGHPFVKEFIWTVGAGESTGAGFGSMDIGRAIRKHEASAKVVQNDAAPEYAPPVT
jgi:CRISPR-associated endoribonuclease Cas6